MDHILLNCLSTQYDDYIRDYIEQNPRWFVTLNDGVTVYQDDGRYEPYSAWLRLRDYCEQTGKYITSMGVGFRDNVKQLPSNKDGYFFCKAAVGCFGYDRTTQLYIVGYLESSNNTIYTTRWKVPEMLDDGFETRSSDTAGECLIRK